MAFDPFDKKINELTKEDLDSLIPKAVAEGYWVEYKSNFQENRKVAKSISSFANTYGGWYFIGIEANNNVASKIVGISLKEIRDPVDKLREIIKSNIDPTPVFYHKAIQLDEPDKVVIAVHIPDNQETPFIVSDGRIYRRVGDSSEPVLENNRYAIDRLVDAGKGLAKEFEEFCQDNRTFSKSEENQSWVNLYFSPYPLGMISKTEMLSEAGLEELISLSQKTLKYYLKEYEVGNGNFPFNSGRLGVGSIILRQVEPSKTGFNSSTVEFFINGQAKFHIPLSYLPVMELDYIEKLKSQIAINALKNILKNATRYDLSVIRFFDIQQLWSIITIQTNFYRNWFGKELGDGKIKLAITLDNTWRLVPFHDSDLWGNFVQKFGLPVQSNDYLRLPTKEGSSIIVDVSSWNSVCAMISIAFGLSPSFFTDTLFNLEDTQP